MVFGLRFDMWLRYRATKLLNFLCFATLGRIIFKLFFTHRIGGLRATLATFLLSSNYTGILTFKPFVVLLLKSATTFLSEHAPLEVDSYVGLAE